MKARETLFIQLLIAGSVSAGVATQLTNTMRDFICQALYCSIAQIAGAIAALIITAAGMRWVGSRSDPGERKKAREIIQHVIIGLVLIAAAGGIVSTILHVGTICVC